MPTIDRIRDALARDPFTADHPGAREAAVAAVLDRNLDLLFIRRAERDGDPWSGQLSFPGGHRDTGDATMLHTAIRETQEEIGLDLSGAQLLGRLDDLPTSRPLRRMVVRPFVFAVPEFGPLTLETNEVADVHTLSLAHLLEGRGRGMFMRDWQGQSYPFPSVDFDGVRLWGLTLLLVDDLLHRLDGQGRGEKRPKLS